jgi:hypothetical protein
LNSGGGLRQARTFYVLFLNSTALSGSRLHWVKRFSFSALSCTFYCLCHINGANIVANDSSNRLFPCDLHGSTAAHDAIDNFKLLVRIGRGKSRC